MALKWCSRSASHEKRFTFKDLANTGYGGEACVRLLRIFEKKQSSLQVCWKSHPVLDWQSVFWWKSNFELIWSYNNTQSGFFGISKTKFTHLCPPFPWKERPQPTWLKSVSALTERRLNDFRIKFCTEGARTSCIWAQGEVAVDRRNVVLCDPATWFFKIAPLIQKVQFVKYRDIWSTSRKNHWSEMFA